MRLAHLAPLAAALLLNGCGSGSCNDICQFQAMMPYVANWQTAIQAKLLAQQNVDGIDGLDKPDSKFAKTWSVATDGRIALSTAGGGIFAVFVPIKDRQTVLWSCYGAPAALFEHGHGESLFNDCGGQWRLALQDVKHGPKRIQMEP
jgi:hypothetical protein